MAKAIPAATKPPPPPMPAGAPPPPPVAGHSMIGTIVGPYRIKRQLGQGLWGRVYEAVQEEVNRAVTIKVLDAQIQQDEARAAQFTSLASRLANLRHNNMVAVYEAGQDGDTRYYAREYITGRTIADIAGAGETLGPSPILKVLVGVARALTYLTQHNIAFGPVPDRNILVDNANGEGRIAGFSFLDGTSGPLGSTVSQEVVRVAQMLWTVVDHTAPQAQQVYTMLGRLLGQGQPFQSIEQLVTEAEAMEQTFHKPVVKPKPKHSAAYRAVAPAPITEEKPWLQRYKRHLIIGAGVAVAAVVVIFAAQFFIQKSKTLPPADVDSFCRVPAGEFNYQDTDKKTTKEFWISKYEVTIGQYKKFWLVAKTKGDAEYAHPKQPKNKDTSHTPSDWEEVLDACQTGIALSNDGQPTTEDYPVFGVDYFDAYAYAKWAGGRLPTEEEWEKAARGTDGRIYPWGNTFDNPKIANTGKDGDDISKGSVDGYVRWAPVHAHPGDVSPWGVRDMAGNVSEWTDSWVPMRLDPKTQTPVIRGGSYADPDVRITQRLTSLPPIKRDRYIGFRIVRDQAPPQTPAK
jgi:formylglycine-generating enzyme required for sulfatase activity